MNACAALVARGDPARFRATMAAPLRLRPILLPLYAFNVEVARAPWVTQEPMIALMRLQWWRDALEEIAEGRPRRHEVVTPLAAVIDAADARLLDRLVEARTADVEAEAPRDRQAVLGYVDATAGTLLRVAARRAGGGEGAAKDAGRAQGIANLLAAVPDLVAKGRHPLPHGDPAEHAAALIDGARAALARARAAQVPKAARPVFLVVPEAEAVLDRLARDPGAVVEGVPQEVGLATRFRRARQRVTGRI
nr:squalene/phytoene synthase family protein [Jannaschia sp. Os4]